MDWYDTSALPQFDHPPVVESAMSIEFGSIPALDVLHLSRLQDRWVDRYPNVSSVAGAPPSQLMQPGPMEMQVFVGQSPPLRIWAEDGHGLLVQSQADRLALNWRAGQGTDYPGYTRLRSLYGQIWADLNTYLGEIGAPAPAPVLAEFTYVNAVPLSVGDTTEDVVTVAQKPSAELPGNPLLTRFQFVRDVPRGADHPFQAQIVAAGEPQPHEDGLRLIFTVTTRAVFGAATRDYFAALDAAHALSSHTFARIVQPEKQTEWGRTQ